METWQFSLFFVALLVGYVLIHLRVVRFEQHMKSLAHLRSIDERLQKLQTQLPNVDKERLTRIEGLLQRLHEDLEDLREATAGVSEAVVQIPRAEIAPQIVQATPGDTAPAFSGSPAEHIRALVESRLLHLGYNSLRVLTDLTGADLDYDVEVQVECERGHMPAKGRVLVRNGTVRDVAIQTVAATFP